LRWNEKGSVTVGERGGGGGSDRGGERSKGRGDEKKDAIRGYKWNENG
jgi:hypothetical protein